MRFGADQEHIGQDVPGSDQDAPALDVSAQDFFHFRAHVQVIIQHDGLPVKHEVFEVGVFCKNIEQFIDQMDEFQPELLEGQVPFAIPVGV